MVCDVMLCVGVCKSDPLSAEVELCTRFKGTSASTAMQAL